MQYFFDSLPSRIGTHCIKWDIRDKVFGNGEVIPLWVADMDFETPDFIMDQIRERAGHPVLGYTYRRDAFKYSFINWIKELHGWEVRPEWVTFSPGVVSAISTSLLAFTSEGDEVIVQPPVYTPFMRTVKGLGRTLLFNHLKLKNGRLNMDFEQLARIITKKTKMLILSNPHNPGGSAWNADELSQLYDICKDHNIMILSDEIHSDLVFSPNSHTPFQSVAGPESKLVITCMAASKTFNIAGMSTSLVIISDENVRKHYEEWLHTLHIGMGNIFGTEATIAAYEKGYDWLQQLKVYLDRNRHYLYNFILNELPEIKMIMPEATYLAWLDFRALNLKQDELVKLLVEKAGLGLNSGTDFGPGGDGFMRLNFACPASLLVQGMNQLKSALV